VENIIDVAEKEHKRKTEEGKKRNKLNTNTKEKATKEKPALEVEEVSSDEGFGHHSDESEGELDVQEGGHQTYQARSRQLALKIAQHVSGVFLFLFSCSPICMIVNFKSVEPVPEGRKTRYDTRSCASTLERSESNQTD